MMKTLERKYYELMNYIHGGRGVVLNTAFLAGLAAMVLMSTPIDAMAQSFSVPFIDGIGCTVANWMKGPLAVLIFVLVVIATLVVGLITKMDWSKIITVAVVFGIIQAFVSIMLSSGKINLPGCLAA